MPVKKDPSGRRSVQAEAEVPGTPDVVWRAIASGPGVSSWFVPTTIEPRVGGAVTSNFGPGMDAVATITAWDPPRRFAAESQDAGPSSPTIATEWTIEARSGGTCVVRVVHSWFASTDEWDNQFEGHEHGWVAFFRVLRIYLSYFRNQPSAVFQVLAMVPGTVATAWSALTGPLGLRHVTEREQVKSQAGAPALSGVVERVGPPDHPELLLRLEEPGLGIAHLLAIPMGEQLCLAVRVFFYGDRAAAIAEREEGTWQPWMREHFPSVGASAVPQES